MESIPDRKRHGPADMSFPPPGGPWEPLALGGRLVGWGEKGGLAAARRSAELGQQLVEEERDYLVGRLGHKLRSAVLALQESARQAAFGRPELLETVFEQAQEVGRRAAALEAAAAVPKERARGVVLAAVLNFILPGAARSLPAEATVVGSEPTLVEAFTRLREWVGADVTVDADQMGGWWMLGFSVVVCMALSVILKTKVCEASTGAARGRPAVISSSIPSAAGPWCRTSRSP